MKDNSNALHCDFCDNRGNLLMTTIAKISDVTSTVGHQYVVKVTSSYFANGEDNNQPDDCAKSSISVWSDTAGWLPLHMLGVSAYTRKSHKAYSVDSIAPNGSYTNRTTAPKEFSDERAELLKIATLVLL